jgi:hypothetical protein
MRTIAKKLGIAAVAALSLAGATLATSDTAQARPWGGHQFRGGGWHGGGWYRGGAGWVAPALIGGLALGALAASTTYGYGYGYGYGYPTYVVDDDYGGCYLKRRVRYTPFGPVVRRVRVCYY